MKKNIVTLLFLIFGLMIGVPSYGQTAGNPAGVRGKGEWTVSAEMTYVEQGISNMRSISRRLLLKSAWGLTPWLDLYLMGGGFQIDLDKQETGIDNLQTKYQLSYGLGFNTSYAIEDFGGISLWSGGQVLRAPIHGTFRESFVAGSEDFDREFRMKYDWIEFQGYAGLIIPVNQLRFYIAGAGWVLYRMDNKKEYLVSETSTDYVGSSESEYRSGLWTGAVIGLEIMFRNRYSFTIEGLFFNEENYHLKLGLCQTGIVD